MMHANNPPNYSSNPEDGAFRNPNMISNPPSKGDKLYPNMNISANASGGNVSFLTH